MGDFWSDLRLRFEADNDDEEEEDGVDLRGVPCKAAGRVDICWGMLAA